MTTSNAHGDARTDILDEHDCRRLIASGGVGRIAYKSRYGYAVIPVNYVLDAGNVIFRTTAGSALDEDLRTGIADADYLVAFEIDHIDEDRHEGWSVLIQGVAHALESESERAATAHLDVRPWPGGGKDLHFRITPTRMTGRAIRRPDRAG